MGSYFNFLLRKTTGKSKLKKKKTVIPSKQIIEKSKKVPKNTSFPIVSGAITAIVFLIVLTVFGKVSASLNTSGMGTATLNLISLIPLILVGAAILGTVTMFFRLGQ